MSDIESAEGWLGKLRELNTVIAAANEPLVGNLMYEHLQADYVSSAPDLILRPKRDRLRFALKGRSSLLEIGVNGGHSAFLALTSNSELRFHGVDICEHTYVKPAVAWLRAEFPGRVHLHEGDSRHVLPELIRAGMQFDSFHVDGAKFTYFEDICNCQRLASGDAIIIVDDTQLRVVSRCWKRCVRQGRIAPVPQFPPMAAPMKYLNAIGRLKPAKARGSFRWYLLLPLRRLRWSSATRSVVRAVRSLARRVFNAMRRRMPGAKHRSGSGIESREED
jgi:Methyltransferase domain